MMKGLGHGRRDEVVEVLVESFWDYPTMAYMLGDGGEHDDAELRALIGMFVDGRYGRESPVLGVEVADQIVGVALVDPPGSRPVREPYRTQIAEAHTMLGEEVGARIKAFGQAAADLEPDEPHYYIGMLGVVPSHQGEGLARELVSEVILMSESDERSKWVCLTTESEANLVMYEALGFSIFGEVRVGDLRSWTLARAS